MAKFSVEKDETYLKPGAVLLASVFLASACGAAKVEGTGKGESDPSGPVRSNDDKKETPEAGSGDAKGAGSGATVAGGPGSSANPNAGTPTGMVTGTQTGTIPGAPTPVGPPTKTSSLTDFLWTSALTEPQVTLVNFEPNAFEGVDYFRVKAQDAEGSITFVPPIPTGKSATVDITAEVLDEGDGASVLEAFRGAASLGSAVQLDSATGTENSRRTITLARGVTLAAGEAVIVKALSNAGEWVRTKSVTFGPAERVSMPVASTSPAPVVTQPTPQMTAAPNPGLPAIVVVGSEGLRAYLSKGDSNFTSLHEGFPGDNNWGYRDVLLGNNIYCAVGGGTPDPGQKMQRTAYSIDGVHWTIQTADRQWVGGVAYGNGVFVAVGGLGLVMRSPDCKTWEILTNPTGSHIRSARFANGTFYAGGEGLSLKSTDNGTTWTQASAAEAPSPHTNEGKNAVRVQFGQWGADVKVSFDSGATWKTYRLPYTVGGAAVSQ